jgi:soluble cytochrome b562
VREHLDTEEAEMNEQRLYEEIEVSISFEMMRDLFGDEAEEMERAFDSQLEHELSNEFSAEEVRAGFTISIGQFDMIEAWDLEGNQVAPHDNTVARIALCKARARTMCLLA